MAVVGLQQWPLAVRSPRGRCGRRRVAAGADANAAARRCATRGPDRIADVTDQVIDAVVNISTSQNVDRRPRRRSRRQILPDVALRSVLRRFLRPQPEARADSTAQRVQSLGSGFVIDAAGIIVTNNHVIDGADEIEVIFNDGTKLNAEVIGTDDEDRHRGSAR